MSNPTQASPQYGTAATPVATALDENKKATEEVKRAADDLAVVQAVLDTKLADGADDGDVARAVAETGEIEKRLSRSADTLDQVNQTLEREVRRSH